MIWRVCWYDFRAERSDSVVEAWVLVESPFDCAAKNGGSAQGGGLMRTHENPDLARSQFESARHARA